MEENGGKWYTDAMSIGSISGMGGSDKLPLNRAQEARNSPEERVEARKREEPEEIVLPEPQPLMITELLEQIVAGNSVTMNAVVKDPPDVVRKRAMDAYRKQSVADIPSMSADTQSDSPENQQRDGEDEEVVEE